MGAVPITVARVAGGPRRAAPTAPLAAGSEIIGNTDGLQQFASTLLD